MSKSMHSIAVISVFFGAWPKSMPFFLHSCRYNPSIDWYIFSDQPELPDVPENVHFMRMELSVFSEMLSGKLALNIDVKKPYKLCDYKPAYGIIFDEYVGSYDFWGYSDIDVVYGNLRAFLTDAVLEGHDVISARPDYMSGPFALYRNCALINTLFEKLADYKTVYQDMHHLHVCDEVVMRMPLDLRSPAMFKIKRKIVSLFRRLCGRDFYYSYHQDLDKYFARHSADHRDISSIVYDLAAQNLLRKFWGPLLTSIIMLKGGGKKEWCFKWERGCLTEQGTGDEAMLLHFAATCRSPSGKVAQYLENEPVFVITEEGIAYASCEARSSSCK